MMIKYLLLSLVFVWSCDKSNGHEISESKDDENLVSNNDSLAEIEDTPNTQDQPETTAVYPLYIGTYTSGESEGIYLAQFDALTGSISKPALVATVDNPSYQCLTPDQSELWTVSESWNGPGQAMGFTIDTLTGELSPKATFPTKGNGPCYISYHSKSKTLLAANYNSGNVVRIGVGDMNQGQTAEHRHSGSGPNQNRQSLPHAHNIHLAPDGRYAYACNLGTDQVYVYDLNQEGLGLKQIIQTEKGAGPRHLAFHPRGKAMTVINELNSTLETYLPDEEGVFSSFLLRVSTIPESFTANNQCADIHYSPDGKYLYASNRGHNSVAVFAIDENTMEAQLIQWMEKAINWPRNFALSPDGNYLLVANQEANQISIYTINKENGQLSFTGNTTPLSKPVCLTFVK